MINGFDVSGNSGNVNFRAAKAAGMRFCFARTGRGVPSSATDPAGLDTRWVSYRDSALDAGLIVGGYWRFYAGVDMALQVRRFASALGQQPGMLGPLVDIEDAGGLSAAALTDRAVRTLDAVQAAVGRRPLLYTGYSFLRTNLVSARLDRWGRCIAHGSATAWPDHSAVFWQRKLDVPAAWAQGNVDLQAFAGRDADLEAHRYDHDLLHWIDDDGQLYGPRAVWAPLPEGQDERQRQLPRRVIKHTMVGGQNGTDAYFRQAAVGVESTVIIGGQYDGPLLDGEIRQLVECDVIANANLDGDRGVPDCVSEEHSDGSNAAHPNRWQERFSAKQAESSWQFTAAVCWRYGIPTTALPDSKEGRSGVGWHRLGIKGNWPDPYPLSGWKPGGDVFSAVTGKQCPGNARILQIYREGIPRIARIVAGVRAPGAPLPTPDVHDPWETTVDPITVKLANTDPPLFAYVCPDGLVVGPLRDGGAGISAFQQLYGGGAVNGTQLAIVQQQRRLAQVGLALPVTVDLSQADADQIAEAVGKILPAAPAPPPV